MIKIVAIVLVLFCMQVSSGGIGKVYADIDESVFEDAVDDTLHDVDFSKLDIFLDDVLNKYGIEDVDFITEVERLLRGEVDIDISDIFTYLISIFFQKVYDMLPTILSIMAVGIISMFLQGVSKSSTSSMVEFISVSSVVLITIVSFRYILDIVRSISSGIGRFVVILSPIMLSLLSVVGSSASVGILTTLIATVSTITAFVFDKLLMPIVVISFVLLVCGSISQYVNLNRLNVFFANTFKFILGATFTIFFGFVGLKSIAIGKFDSISIRATKFAISSYIPFIGSYISQGFDYVVMGSMLIKNAIGVIGICIIVLIVVVDIVNMFIVKLCYDMLAGVLEFMGSESISKYVDRFSKLLTLPIILSLGIAFIYVVALVVIISTANVGAL